MCSSLALTLYMVIMIVALVLAIIAFSTPAWRAEKIVYNGITWDELGQDIKDSIKAAFKGEGKKFEEFDYTFGLVTKYCGEAYNESLWDNCVDTFNNKTAWEKAVIAGMAGTILMDVVSIIWGIVVCTMCCCRSCLAPPLAIFPFFAALFMLISVIIFGVKSEADKRELAKIPTDLGELELLGDFAYSFYIACACVIVNAAGFIAGIFAAKITKISPI